MNENTWKLLTAIATAISDSVTVSIGDDTNGARNEIDFVRGDVRSTSSAVKSMKPGKIMKSLEKCTNNRNRQGKKKQQKIPVIVDIYYFFQAWLF